MLGWESRRQILQSLNLQGQASGCNLFPRGRGRIPVLSEQPIRILGRKYSAELTDKHMATTVTAQLKDGLKRTDQSYLPGKHKLWCYQFTLYQCVMWPLKMCEITATTVARMDAISKSYIRKWLDVAISLWFSIVLTKCSSAPTKEHLTWVQAGEDQAGAWAPTIKWSFCSKCCAKVQTGRKWKAEECIDNTIANL